MYSISLPSASVLLSLAEGTGETAKQVKSRAGGMQQRDRDTPRISNPCSICLGMLQMADPTEWVGASEDIEKHLSKTEILEATKLGGHKFESFCLEVSVPAVTLVRERALWYCCLLGRIECSVIPARCFSICTTESVSSVDAVQLSLEHDWIDPWCQYHLITLYAEQVAFAEKLQFKGFI